MQMHGKWLKMRQHEEKQRERERERGVYKVYKDALDIQIQLQCKRTRSGMNNYVPQVL